MKEFKLNKMSLVFGILVAAGTVDSKVIATQGLHEFAPLYRTETGFSKEVEIFIQDVVTDRMPGATSKTLSQVTRQILLSSVESNLDPILILAVIQHESKFNSKTIGDAGEIGLMQIKPTTASWIAKRMGLKTPNFSGTHKTRLFDPKTNIQLGSAYLAYMKEKFPKHNSLFLSAYNMGAANVMKNLNKQRLPHQYSSKVMTQYYSIYRALKEKLSNRELASSI